MQNNEKKMSSIWAGNKAWGLRAGHYEKSTFFGA